MPYFLSHWVSLLPVDNKTDDRNENTNNNEKKEDGKKNVGNLENGGKSNDERESNIGGQLKGQNDQGKSKEKGGIGKKPKIIRTVAYQQGRSSKADLQRTASEERAIESRPKPEISFLIELRDNIKTELQAIQNSPSPLTTDDDSFNVYAITEEDVVFTGRYSNIYLATHSDFHDYPLICRVFEPTASIEPAKARFLKVLKHINAKSPYLMATWDVFHDDNNRIALFHEYAIHGNLMDYLKMYNVFVPEIQLIEWAQNLYNGMDFLGSSGICHRGICPKHVLLTPGVESDKIIAKISSFRDSIYYFDPVKSVVINQPCRSVNKRFQGNFQAPEIYGHSNEEFDPIAADVWSYGATLFYAACRAYPYKYKRPSSDLESEIRKTIDFGKNLSNEAKRWLVGLLKTNTSKRTTFDCIPNDPWYKTILN